MEAQKQNNQLKLKICGVTKSDQIHELVSIKIDFLGFIFYEKSPRYVLKHLHLKDILNINHNCKTGVFVNENVNKIVENSLQAGLNFVQLHGDESENFIAELRKELPPKTKIIKVIRIGNQKLELKTLNLDNINYLLFDTDSKTFGGTGKQFDWNILNEINIPLPYFLSGGLSDENIDKIKMLNQKPFAIDINSKFEIDYGVKDINRIKAFRKNIINRD